MADDFDGHVELQEHIFADIDKMTSIWRLNMIYNVWEEKMKALAAEILKPGSHEPITEEDGGLSALDYIWDLAGQKSWSSADKEEPKWKALDYYLGRKVEHIWGTGILVKMKEGYGIKVPLQCGTEGCRHKMIVYMRPGCHNGAFCYAYNKDGEYFADLRNQWFNCGRCGVRKRKTISS